MADVQIYFEPNFRFLICKLHGNGIHPAEEAIKRHLRGKDHRCRGERLRWAISTLTNLPLRSLEAVLNAQPAVDEQPITPPLPHLRVLPGWNCTPCAGEFLTTSLEVVQRHVALHHGRRRGEQPLWEVCELQTFFSETKDRRYFRVASLPVDTTSSEEQTYENTEPDGIQYVQAWGRKLDQKEKVTWHTNTCPASPTRHHLTEGCVSTAENDKKPWELQTSHSQSLKIFSSPAQHITFRHPFTDFAAKHVRLSVSRLDHLFKSDAFRVASNPLFDSSHADAALNIHAVFPQGEEEPVFLNALLYSTVQIINHGTPTTEGHLLQQRMVKLLNERLSSPPPTLSPVVLGAIMALKATAYRTRDLAAHDTHTQGLTAALRFITKSGNSLTQGAQRAIFWLDLNAAVLVNGRRCMSHLNLPQIVNWQRETYPELAHSLPIGFVRHRDALSDGLCECISDTIEFQTHLRIGAIARASHYTKFHQLDAMQASIESRLELQAQACRQLGVVAEAVRLGVFMCCYCSWMETWNDTLIPCRLAEKLLEVLEPTVSFISPLANNSVWLGRMDILLWLLLVGSSVIKLDRGHAEGLKIRQSRLVSSVSSARDFSRNFCKVDLKQELQNALRNFIYKDEWVPQRWYIKDWFEMELSIGSSDT
ncbi:hypothetical protein B7463_g3289, partial [Scytalidium lignicola]